MNAASLPYDFTKSADRYIKVSEKLNEAAGIKIGHHNHNSEFKEFDEITDYEILLQQTDKKLVDFELDLY